MIKFKFPSRTQQVSLYMDKFSGVCQSVLHECKLTFLQIISDHDLFVEMPGRDPSDRCSPLETSLPVYSVLHCQTFSLYYLNNF